MLIMKGWDLERKSEVCEGGGVKTYNLLLRIMDGGDELQVLMLVLGVGWCSIVSLGMLFLPKAWKVGCCTVEGSMETSH